MAIAQHVGLSLRTRLQRDLRTATFAGRKRRSDEGDSLLNPYKPYLLERWRCPAERCLPCGSFARSVSAAMEEAMATVAAYACRLRQARGLPPGHPPSAPAPACSGRASVPALDSASGDLAGAAARGETYASRDPSSSTQLHAQSAGVAEAIDLAQDLLDPGAPAASRRSSIYGSRAPPPARSRLYAASYRIV